MLKEYQLMMAGKRPPAKEEAKVIGGASS